MDALSNHGRYSFVTRDQCGKSIGMQTRTHAATYRTSGKCAMPGVRYADDIGGAL